ncbi:MAG: putative DNA binding domain-containing protein [Bernardetiaceae bacterium]|jgi:predicted HTH transcriptional regulator|nr:putative DNA binding domain-containing protein [Bernardetiaceae bacterium]
MIDKVDLLDLTISGIEKALATGQFQDYVHTIIELKDLSTGNEWTSLKQTICAFLNTNGGYVIAGIRERNHQYAFPGFDRNNEGRLIELRNKFFKNDREVLPDLSENIDLDYRTLLGKTLAIITVRPLSEDLKYLKFEGVYYERVLTQDKVISPAKLIQHQEYKAELEYSKEISPVKTASLNDLDIDKINQFIIRINGTGKKETIKKDIQDAADFLTRRYSLNADGAVTVLGLLLFSKEPFQHLEYRAEVDCYFETKNEIGRDKKIYQNDVLSLMEDAFSFIWGHIKVGTSYIGGGRSEPEFPEKLVREVINNAFAHRDYVANRFVTIKINPGENIEMKNPGSFKQKMLIRDISTDREVRRVIPGVPETKNPKLANILKAFDKIESQGIGMATLVSVCLENQIDVPYYDLSVPETISLMIPSGKLLDDETQRWLNALHGYLSKRLNGRLTPEHQLVLAYLLKSERLNQKRFYTILLSPNNNHFEVLAGLKKSGLVVEHPAASTEQTPVYVLDSELTITDFTKQIENKTGKSLSGLDATAIRVLNIIYRYNQYNDQSVKPNMITPELYHQLHGQSVEPTTYESLGRKVRRICADLLKVGILSKKDGKAYEIK